MDTPTRLHKLTVLRTHTLEAQNTVICASCCSTATLCD